MTRHELRLSVVLLALAAGSLSAMAAEPAGVEPKGATPAGYPTPTGPVAASLEPFVENHTLAGAVVLATDKEKILCLEAVGYADIAAKRPMQVNDLFWIASMSKAMTAAGLMMLVDEGKVNVDDPVEKYLPEFKGQMVAVKKDGAVVLEKPAHPITVKNVLTHTSGLPFGSAEEGRVGPTYKADKLSLRDAVASYARAPLEFQPDSKYQYSNAGINTAGRIIEVVSGMPYEKFMQERLLGPLGMKDTTWRPSEEQVSRLAKSYKVSEDGKDLVETPVRQLTYPLTNPQRGASPAGGLFSTATDVSHFCQMFLNNGQYQGKRLLSEAAVKQITTNQIGELKAGNLGYGFGWQVAIMPAGKGPGVYSHGGAYLTSMRVDPARGIATVYMVQHEKYGKDESKIHPALDKAMRDVIGNNSTR